MIDAATRDPVPASVGDSLLSKQAEDFDRLAVIVDGVPGIDTVLKEAIQCNGK